MKNFRAKRITALITALALITVGGVYATWYYETSSSQNASVNFNVNMTTDSVTTGTSRGTYSVTKTVDTIYKLDQYSDAVTKVGSTYDYIVLPKFSGATTTGEYIAITAYSGSTFGSGDSFTYVDLDLLVKWYNNGGSKVTDYEKTCSTTSTVYDTHTAALCITKDSAINITFTSSEDSSATSYNYSVYTTFALAWNNTTLASPTIMASYSTSGYYYYNTAGSPTEVLKLNTDAQYIYAYGTSDSVGKVWPAGTSGAFTYTVSSAELATYLTPAAIFVLDDTYAYDAMNTALSGDAGKLTMTIGEAGTALTKVTTFSVIDGGSYSITDAAANDGLVGNYRIGFFLDSTSGSPIYYYDAGTSTSGSISTVINTAFVSGTDYTMESGKYYIKVRVIPTTGSGYGNSAWSSVATYYVSVVNTGSGYTITYGTDQNTLGG